MPEMQKSTAGSVPPRADGAKMPEMPSNSAVSAPVKADAAKMPTLSTKDPKDFTADVDLKHPVTNPHAESSVAKAKARVENLAEKAAAEAASVTAPAKSEPTTTPAEKTENVQFSTQNIGAWKSKQENYFDKQNQKAAEKKAKQEETKKKLKPYFKWGLIGLGAAAVITAVIIVLVITMKTPEGVPAISGNTLEDSNEYRNKLQAIYDESEDYNKVDEAVNALLNTNDGRRYEAQIKMSQALLYFQNGEYQNAGEIAQTVNPNDLILEQQMQYYTILGRYSRENGDKEKENEYNSALYDLIYENAANGGGGA